MNQTQKAREHLDTVSSGPDKSNAQKFLDGKMSIETQGNSTRFIIGKESLDLWKMAPNHRELMQRIIETLLVEKSVCEARAYLAAECKAEVASPWSMPLIQKGDIEFNPSFWRGNTGVVRYEVLQEIFGTKSVRSIAKKIVDFVNNFPTHYIPREVIELPYENVDSYTSGKNNTQNKTTKQ